MVWSSKSLILSIDGRLQVRLRGPGVIKFFSCSTQLNVYVKRGIPCKRRLDLELVNIECVWIEIIVKNKKLLIGTFYRPPTASPVVLSDIENSIGLAIDTGVEDIVVTGDLKSTFADENYRSMPNI